MNGDTCVIIKFSRENNKVLYNSDPSYFQIETLDDYYQYIVPEYIEQVKELDIEFKNTHNTPIATPVRTKTDRWIKITRKFDTQNSTELLYIFDDITSIYGSDHKLAFLSNISHEVRTPINGIVGMMTLLEDTTLNREQKGYIEMLRECCITLMSLINDILDFSKLEAGNVKLDNAPMDITDCIRSSEDIFKSKILEKNLDYDFIMTKHTPKYIIADTKRIKQIILNLMSNSIKYTESGCISLTIDTENIDQTHYFLKFSITDTGCGINKNIQGSLFSRSFDKTRCPEDIVDQGAGLGLVISKGLVNLMGGKIWVDWSVPGKGTRICFTIKTTTTDRLDIINFEEDKLILENKSIFILDDKLENRLSLVNFTQKLKMNPTLFTTGQEALYYSKNTDYDIGLVDIIMPEMNGIDFANRLKHQELSLNKRPVPLIAISSIEKDLLDVTPDVFTARLLKPVNELELKKKLITILNSSQYMYPNKKKFDIIKKNISILIAEDIPTNQRVLVSFLNKMNFYNITTTTNGKECIKLLSNNEKHYDIVLLDIKMPIFNGEETCKYILKNIKPVPYLIAITAYCLKEDKLKYLNMGFNDYIPKPISIKELDYKMTAFIDSFVT